jgi:hypothetical protein
MAGTRTPFCKAAVEVAGNGNPEAAPKSHPELRKKKRKKEPSACVFVCQREREMETDGEGGGGGEAEGRRRGERGRLLGVIESSEVRHLIPWRGLRKSVPSGPSPCRPLPPAS